ncbi:MAG: T9SS type A sorting domain-containing protein [Acidobacteriota bacterium]
MKKVFAGITAAFFILICSGSLNANPIRTTFFSELVFDSTGWKLEMCLNSGSDSLSLKGWYIVSGQDTAYFKDWMYLGYKPYEGKRKYLVLTKDSLSGKIDLDMEADTLFLYSPDGYRRDWLIYGSNTTYVPSLKPNQSICLLPDSYYLDNTPTIGLANDTSGATGRIHAYVTDKDGNPASRVSYFLYWEDKLFVTDSTGHFKFDNILASSYTFYFSQGAQKKFFNAYVEPGKTTEVTFQLDWVTDVESGSNTVKEYSLEQNYPNPFNPATSITYSVPKSGVVKLWVHDLLGKEVMILVNEYKTAGSYKVSFNAQALPSGVYLYSIKAGEFSITKKMTLIK